MSLFGCCCKEDGLRVAHEEVEKKSPLVGLDNLSFEPETPRRSPEERINAKEQIKTTVKEFARTASKEGFYVKCAGPQGVPEVVTLKLDKNLKWISLHPAPLFLRRVPDDLATGAVRLPLSEIKEVLRGRDWLLAQQPEGTADPEQRALAISSVVLLIAPEDSNEELEPLLLVVHDDKERRRLFVALKVIRMSAAYSDRRTSSCSSPAGLSP